MTTQLIHFETDFKKVVDEIERESKRLQTIANRESGGASNASLKNFPRELSAMAAESARILEGLQDKLNRGVRIKGGFTNAANEELRRFETQAIQRAGGRGIEIETALKLTRGARAQLAAEVQETIDQAVAGGRRSLRGQSVGSGYEKRELTTRYNQGVRQEAEARTQRQQELRDAKERKAQARADAAEQRREQQTAAREQKAQERADARAKADAERAEEKKRRTQERADAAEQRRQEQTAAREQKAQERADAKAAAAAATPTAAAAGAGFGVNAAPTAAQAKADARAQRQAEQQAEREQRAQERADERARRRQEVADERERRRQERAEEQARRRATQDQERQARAAERAQQRADAAATRRAEQVALRQERIDERQRQKQERADEAAARRAEARAERERKAQEQADAKAGRGREQQQERQRREQERADRAKQAADARTQRQAEQVAERTRRQQEAADARAQRQAEALAQRQARAQEQADARTQRQAEALAQRQARAQEQADARAQRRAEQAAERERREQERLNRPDASGRTAAERARQAQAGQANRARYDVDQVVQRAGGPAAFTDVGGGYVKELRDGVERFYRHIAGRLDEVAATDPNLRRHVERFNAATERAARAAEILPDGPGSRPIAGVADLGGGYYKDLRDGVVRYYQALSDGLRDVTNDIRARNAILEREARSAAREAAGGAGGRGGGGVTGNFVHGLFSGGFGGETGGVSGLDGLARAAGNTVKYSALYGALNQITQAFSFATQEVLNYSDSLTDLEIAIENLSLAAGDTPPDVQGLTDDLADVAIQSGANIGDAMDVAGAQLRALGLESDLTGEKAANMAVSFTKAAGQLAFIAKTDIQDAKANILAISSAFDLGQGSGARVVDAIATAKLVGGGDEKQTFQAVASAAQAGQAAGFDPETLAALASRIQLLTDQTGAAVGNKISRFLSTAGGSQGQNAIANVNAQLDEAFQINQAAPINEQILQLSQNYDNLTESQRRYLANAIGGTTSYREFLVTLQQLSKIVENNGDGLYHAGAGAEEAEKRAHDLTRELLILKGTLSALVTDALRSGLLDPFILAFKAVVEIAKALHGLERILINVNELTSGWGFKLAAILATLTAIGKIQALGGVRGALLAAERGALPANAAARAQLAGAGGAAGNAAAAAAAGAAAGGRDKDKNPRLRRLLGISSQTYARAPGILGYDLAQLGQRDVRDTFKGSRDALRNGRTRLQYGTGLITYREALARGVTPGRSIADRINDRSERRNAFGPQPATLMQKGAMSFSKGIDTFTRGLGGLVSTLTSPIALFAGGLLIAGAAFEAYKGVEAGKEGADKALRLRDDFDPTASVDDQIAQYRDIAAQQAAARVELDSKRNSFLGSFFDDPSAESRSNRLAFASQQAENNANRLSAALDNLGSATNQLSVFGDPATRTVESVAEALQALGERGVDPFRQAELLGALDGAGPDANALAPVQRGRIASGVVNNLYDSLGTSLEEQVVKTSGGGKRGGGGGGRSDVLSTVFADMAPEINRAIGDALPQNLPAQQQRFTPEQIATAATAGAEAARTRYQRDFDKIPQGRREGVKTPDEVYRETFDKVSTELAEVPTSFTTPKGTTKSGADAFSYITKNIIPTYDAILQLQLPGDAQGQLTVLEGKLGAIDRQIAMVEPGDVTALKGLTALRNQAVDQIARVKVEDAQKILAAAQAKAQTPEELAEAGKTFFKTAIAEAAKAKDVDLLTQVMDLGNQQLITAARNELVHQQAVAKATMEANKKRATVMAAALLASGAIGLADYQDVLDGLYQKFGGDAGYKDFGDQLGAFDKATGYTTAPEKGGIAETGTDDPFAQTNLEIAKRNRYTFPESSIDTAERALNDVNTQLDVYKDQKLNKDDKYYALLNEQFQKKKALADARNDLAKLRRLLAIDISDPVAVANAEYQDALDAQREANARAAKAEAEGKGDAAEQIRGEAILNTRRAYLAKESAAFQEWLSALQTNEQLGRISHGAYLDMLKGRRDQLALELAQMKSDETGRKQKQQALDQIDQAIKAASDSLNGMFNLGDIKVPTVYQVRRSLKEGVGQIGVSNRTESSRAGVANIDNSSNSVTVNGVPLNQVIKYINDVYGKKSGVATKKRIR